MLKPTVTSQVQELIAEMGRTEVERHLDVHHTTVRRWMSGESEPPKAVLIALRALRGQLPGMESSKAWHGWRFDYRTTRLHGPDGESMGPGDVRVQLIERQQIADLKREVDELRAALAHQARAVNSAANDVYLGQPSGIPRYARRA